MKAGKYVKSFANIPYFKQYTYDPGHFVMELNRPNIVQMTMQSEETTTILRPNVFVDG